MEGHYRLRGLFALRLCKRSQGICTTRASNGLSEITLVSWPSLSCPPLASSRRDRSFAALLDSASRARSRDNSSQASPPDFQPYKRQRRTFGSIAGELQRSTGRSERAVQRDAERGALTARRIAPP